LLLVRFDSDEQMGSDAKPQRRGRDSLKPLSAAEASSARREFVTPSSRSESWFPTATISGPGALDVVDQVRLNGATFLLSDLAEAAVAAIKAANVLG
jgi:hypothetical protein